MKIQDKVKISKLPSILKGTTVFKLPMADVDVGTVFTISALPSSTIYIVRVKDGGWSDQVLLDLNADGDKEFSSADTFELSKSSKDPGQLPTKFRIFELKTGSKETTTTLPSVDKGSRHIAIFLKEGSFRALPFFDH